jgi:uncharacterized protein (DUF2236 family)
MANFESMANKMGVTIPSNPVERETIKASLEEISDAMTLIEAKREYISEVIKALAEKHELPPKFLRKMAVAYHRQTFQKEKREMEEFEALYESIIGDA